VLSRSEEDDRCFCHGDSGSDVNICFTYLVVSMRVLRVDHSRRDGTATLRMAV
jgi:hypothetical protein